MMPGTVVGVGAVAGWVGGDARRAAVGGLGPAGGVPARKIGGRDPDQSVVRGVPAGRRRRPGGAAARSGDREEAPPPGVLAATERRREMTARRLVRLAGCAVVLVAAVHLVRAPPAPLGAAAALHADLGRDDPAPRSDGAGHGRRCTSSRAYPPARHAFCPGAPELILGGCVSFPPGAHVARAPAVERARRSWRWSPGRHLMRRSGAPFWVSLTATVYLTSISR